MIRLASMPASYRSISFFEKLDSRRAMGTISEAGRLIPSNSYCTAHSSRPEDANFSSNRHPPGILRCIIQRESENKNGGDFLIERGTIESFSTISIDLALQIHKGKEIATHLGPLCRAAQDCYSLAQEPARTGGVTAAADKITSGKFNAEN